MAINERWFKIEMRLKYPSIVYECNWWPLLIWHMQLWVFISGSDLAQSLQKVPPLRYLLIEFVTIVYLASLKQPN